MKNFVFRLLAYFVCAFIMMIGFSFMTSLPEGIESLYSSWLTSNYLGLLIISFPLSYIINDMINLLKGYFSENEKGLSFNFFSFKSPLDYVSSQNKNKVKKIGSNNMILREIQPQDNAALEQIIKAIFPEFELPLVGTAYEDKETTTMYESYQGEKEAYFVVEVNGEVLGGGGIKPLKGMDGVCELQKLYFTPSSRGSGYGKLVFNKCMEAAKAFGYDKCYLESASQMKKAISIYEKDGFVHLDKPVGDTGHFSCGVWMIKDL